MKLQLPKVVQFLSHAIIPVICSIVLGATLCGAEVFNRYSTAFQFVHSSIIASVFYFLFIFGRPRDAYAGLVTLLILTIVSTGSTTALFILRDIFYVAAIAMAVLLYINYFKRAEHISHFYAAIVMAGLYGTTYVIASEVHLLIVHIADPLFDADSAYGAATVAAFYGSTIGFAVGGGMTLSDKILTEIRSSFTDEM